jgi:hypothetical protein
LRLSSENPVSKFAFKFNLYRYSEGTMLGPKVTVDLEGMCNGQNLEAALALLLEERLLKVYVTERSAEAETLQRQLMAEIDEAEAETERREARKAKEKAKKAKAKTRKKERGGMTSGTDGIESVGGLTAAETTDGEGNGNAGGGDGDEEEAATAEAAGKRVQEAMAAMEAVKLGEQLDAEEAEAAAAEDSEREARRDAAAARSFPAPNTAVTRSGSGHGNGHGNGNGNSAGGDHGGAGAGDEGEFTSVSHRGGKGGKGESRGSLERSSSGEGISGGHLSDTPYGRGKNQAKGGGGGGGGNGGGGGGGGGGDSGSSNIPTQVKTTKPATDRTSSMDRTSSSEGLAASASASAHPTKAGIAGVGKPPPAPIVKPRAAGAGAAAGAGSGAGAGAGVVGLCTLESS